MIELVEGDDFRRPELRREVFLRFYEFHLRYRSHPGGVYYLIPALAEAFGWGDDELAWWCLLNGLTQNPVTTTALWRRAPSPAHVDRLDGWFRANYGRLPVDTDRRHHKPHLLAAAHAYADLGWTLDDWRSVAGDGWAAAWAVASSWPTFGRLSTWSYLEYVAIAGVRLDPDDLMLDDLDGSRSHRNGLAIVCGRDDLDWHASNPTFDGRVDSDTLAGFAATADDLLAETRRRAGGAPWATDIGRLTIESALCTYKSWHRPRRRYPNVYNDLLHDRLVAGETAWPDLDWSPLWEAREAALPPHLRLEATPTDPGCVPTKQDHYRLTGEVVMMDRDWPCFRNAFNDAVDAGVWGQLRRPR